MMKTGSEIIDVVQLRELLKNASSIEEIQEIAKCVPIPTQEHIEIANKILDDGVYDSTGLLIGEMHSDD